MSRCRRLFTCLIILATCNTARSAIHYDLKATNDSTAPVTADIIVDVSPEEVFDLWTCAEGVRQFWVADAIIEPAVGGRYELMFNIPEDAAGPYDFMYETKILAVECGRSLSFEFRRYRWDRDERHRGNDFHALLSGRTAGTGIIEEAMFRGSWVELRFDSINGEPAKTRVRLIHHDVGRGAPSSSARDYLTLYWRSVLGKLRRACE